MAKKKRIPQRNAKTWSNYVNYIAEHHQRTDWVLRDHPYPEYHQFPEEKRDFREEIDDRLRKEMVMDALMTLTERERNVILHRFGMLDGVPKTLDELAEMYNVCGPRIREIEGRALRKMRHPTRAKMLLEPWEYQKRRDEQEARWAKEEEERKARQAERDAKEAAWRAERQREYDQLRIQQEREREERYQIRQREAWDKYRAMIEEEVERERLYRERKARQEEYDRIQALHQKHDDWQRIQKEKAEKYHEEMARKAKEYQEEARRPYAWCPRTKTKKYLDE